MIAAANILTDLYLSLGAVLGLFVLHLTLSQQDPYDPLNRRFIFGVRVTIALFAARALVVLTGGLGFRAVILLAAALVPLAVLLLTEGLLRRHAPQWVKFVVAGGTIVFAVLAFVPDGWIDPTRLWVLMAFQIAGLGYCSWLVVTRDRASLSGPENLTVSRISLSLILLIPMIALDFTKDLTGMPVQLSAIGVLTLCWLAIGLGGPQSGHRVMITGFLVMCAAGIASSGLIALLTGTGTQGWILGGAVIMTAILLVMILHEARQTRVATRSLTLLRHLARGPATDALDFLRGLQNHPAVEGAAVIEEAALHDLNRDTLTRIFGAAPVLRRADPPKLDATANDHITHLFDRYAASHIMQVSAEPRRLIALSMPTLGMSPNAELELDAVQRMAALMAAREGG